MATEASSVIVREGQAAIKFSTAHDVFYNPVQECNRDLSCAVIRTLSAVLKCELGEGKAGKGAGRSHGGNRGHSVKSDSSSSASAAVAKSSVLESVGISPVSAAIEAASKSGKPRHERLTVLEALSATGLRAIRYKKEIDEVACVIANDLDPAAVETIRRNVLFNGLDPDTDVIPNEGDAAIVMLQAKGPVGARDGGGTYDIVDIDPYGGCHPFLEGAVQAVRDGGLLCVTSTDMAVLCGNHVESCMNKYGAVSIGGKNVHEMALRILLGSLERAANRFNRVIEPMVSLSIDFYARLFVRVKSSALAAKDGGVKQGFVYACTACGSFSTQRMMRKVITDKGGAKWQAANNQAPTSCEHCGKGVMKMAGPMWLDPLHNKLFLDQLHDHLLEHAPVVDAGKISQHASSDAAEASAPAVDPVQAPMYGQHQRIFGLVSAAREELLDVPLYYTLPGLASATHVQTPPKAPFFAAIRALGEQVSASHCDPQAIKTSATTTQIWDIIRSWHATNPSKRSLTQQNTPGFAILSRPPSVMSDFSDQAMAKAKADAHANSSGVPKWLPNPEPNWGPKPRAGTRKAQEFYAPSVTEGGVSDKQKSNQGLRTKRRRVEAEAGPSDHDE